MVLKWNVMQDHMLSIHLSLIPFSCRSFRLRDHRRRRWRPHWDQRKKQRYSEPGYACRYHVFSHPCLKCMKENTWNANSLMCGKIYFENTCVVFTPSNMVVVGLYFNKPNVMVNISAGGSVIGSGCVRDIFAVFRTWIMCTVAGGGAKGLSFDK